MTDDLPLHRRIAELEARVAALEADRVHVTDVERIDVGPTDVLFVHLPADTAKAEMDEAARVIAETLGTRRVLMLAGDMRVSAAELAPDGDECPECRELPGLHDEGCSRA